MTCFHVVKRVPTNAFQQISLSSCNLSSKLTLRQTDIELLCEISVIHLH